MTKIVLEEINNIEDLLLFSKAYKEGLIKLNISKLAKDLKLKILNMQGFIK